MKTDCGLGKCGTVTACADCGRSPLVAGWADAEGARIHARNQGELAAVDGALPPVKRQKKERTPEQRKAMSEAQKKRWANR